MSVRERVLEAVVEGRLSSTDAAETLGLPVEQLERVLHATKRRRSVRVGLMVAGVAVVGVVMSAPVFAQVTCAQTLPAPLVTFCPDAPATASDVNRNFQEVLNFLTTKVGPLASGSITATGLATTGSVNSTSVNSTTVNTTGALTVGGGATVTGTLTVSGPVASGCPSTFADGGVVDLVDVGPFCIMRQFNNDLARAAKSWVTTNEYCVRGGLRMCTFSEVNAATRLGKIRTYSFNTEGDYWTWVDQTASDGNASGFGGCHVNMTHDRPTYPLGEINCAIDGTAVNGTIAGLCCL